MAHFIKPPTSTEMDYDADNKLAPGSLWRVRVPLGDRRKVALWGDYGLKVTSNNNVVVPNNRIGESRSGDLRIFELFGQTLGYSNLEARDQYGALAVFVQIWVDAPRPHEPRYDPHAQPNPEIGPYVTPADYGRTIEFFIKMVGAASIGPAVKMAEYGSFLIWNKIHEKACYFDRLAIGVQIPTPLPGGLTSEGPFNRFVTHKPMLLEDFKEASVTFASRGTADVGTSSLSIRPKGFPSILIDPFETGFSWGFTYQSVSYGVFLMNALGVVVRKHY
jgi:hypothetical protein